MQEEYSSPSGEGVSSTSYPSKGHVQGFCVHMSAAGESDPLMTTLTTASQSLVFRPLSPDGLRWSPLARPRQAEPFSALWDHTQVGLDFCIMASQKHGVEERASLGGRLPLAQYMILSNPFSSLSLRMTVSGGPCQAWESPILRPSRLRLFSSFSNHSSPSVPPAHSLQAWKE